jgi:hypothetical protein
MAILPLSNVDKALLPESPLLQDNDEEPIEIIIGDPEGDLLESVEVEIEEEPSFDANLAEYIDAGVLESLASELLEDFNNDKNARKEWEQTYVDGLDLLGLQLEERTEPWNGACGVYHPMLTEAAIKFQAEMIAETFPAQGPVKTKIVGKETRENEEAAARVAEDMNYQLTEKMQEFRPEHEKMLWSLSLAGAAFKKVYFDPSLNRQVSMFVPAEDLYIPYGASDARTAPRVTHLMRKTENEVKKLQYAGFYRDVDLGEPSKDLDEIQSRKDEADGFSAINDDRFRLLEIHTELDLEGFEDIDPETEEETGIALPFVVTVEKSTQKILSIRRNWDEYDPLKRAKQHFVQYTYIPGFGAYGYGLIHLVGGFAKSATSIVRQLIDAGTLSNLPGGLKTKGMRVKGDDTPIMPGEWRDVDVPSGTVRDNIMPLPYKEPSATLFQLLQNVVEEGRRLAAVADVKFDSMSGEAPVGTTLAILERTLKVMSAVQARVHYSMAQEFKLIAHLIKEYTAPEYEYNPEYDVGPGAKKGDYEVVEVLPVSDPNAATMAQRIIQYQAAIQLAQQSPQIYDLPVLHRQMLEVMGIKDADKIVKTDDDLVPTDPVTENMAIINQQPVKAFIEQDHAAHLAVHQSAMQDPKIAQAIGQNPQAQAIMQAAQAHIAEHVAFQYRREVEAQLGMPLPDPEQKMDAETERQLSVISAQAATQALQRNQAESQAQIAQQQQQDPIIQMQMQELQLKQQEVQQKYEIEMAKLQNEMQIAMMNNENKLMIQGEKDKTANAMKSVDIGYKVAEKMYGAGEKAGDREHAAGEKEKDRAFSTAQGEAQRAAEPKKEPK